MAGGAPSHTDWLQFETLVRYNLPQHLTQALYHTPAPLTRTEQQHREEIEAYLATIERLMKQSEDLCGRLEAKEAEVARYKAATDPAKDGLLLRVKTGATSPEEAAALRRDLETARLKAQTNEETIVNLERMLKLYKERIRMLELQLRDRDSKSEVQLIPLRYRDRTLDLAPLVEQAKEHDAHLAALLQLSETTVKVLAGKMSPVPEALAKRMEELTQIKAKLRSEPHTQKNYTPQEGAEKTSIFLANSAAKEDLLRQYESLKTDIATRWYEYELASILLNQKEELADAVANARISAAERSPAAEDAAQLEGIDNEGTAVGQSEAPLLDKCVALQKQLAALARVHGRILATNRAPFGAPWELEKVAAAQEKATTQSEDNLEQLLEISGKPKDGLNALKAKRTKLKAERTGPTLPSHSAAQADLQTALEVAKRQALEDLRRNALSASAGDNDAKQRLKAVLEKSELSLATLADLATRDPAPVHKLTTERQSAQSLTQLLALEEEHQALREQYLKDIPHVLVASGGLKAVLDAVKAMRTDLKDKLRTAKQTQALDDVSKSDPLEAEASEALKVLSQPSSREVKEKTLFALHDHLEALIAKHREAQGAGFVEVDDHPQQELLMYWRRMIETINQLVSLLADSFHKLTIDDPETKAELEAILDTQSRLQPTEPDFPTGYDFSLEVIAAIRRMLSDTNNLTDVIAAIKEVDTNLLRFEQIMQDNYYKLKPVVGTEEVQGRRGGRKTTFLHITHAEPTNPKEGMNILMEIISTLKKNTDNLFEIESKRVGVVENSLNIKRARDGLELLRNIEEAEKRLRAEDVATLKSTPEAEAEVKSAETLSTASLDPLEQIPNYSESITFFLKLVMPWLEKSLEFDKALNALIKKVKQGTQGIPEDVQAGVESANQDLEEVYEENGEITDMLFRLEEDPTLSQRIEQLRKEHVDIAQQFEGWGDIQRLFRMVTLLSKWMPPEKKLVSQIKLGDEEEDAEGARTKAAGLKDKRTKVKSGRPAQNPFTPVLTQTDKLMTDLAALLKQNQGPENLHANLLAKVHTFNEEQPFESLSARIAPMEEAVEYLLAHPAKPASAEQSLDAATQARLRELAEQQDKMLEGLGELLPGDEPPQDLVDAMQEAVQTFDEKNPVDGLLKKAAAVSDAVNFLLSYIPTRLEELETRITEKETTVITVENDAASRQVVQLQADLKKKQMLYDSLEEEVKDLRAFKSQREGKDDRAFTLEAQLKANLKELEETKKRLAETDTQLRKTTEEKVKLEREQSAAINRDSEIKTLTDLRVAQEAMLKEREAQYKAATDALQAKLDAQHTEIATLRQSLEDVKADLSNYLSKYHNQLQKRMIMSLSTTLKFEKAASLLSWKLKTLKKYQAGATIPAINWTFTSKIVDPSAGADRKPANDFLSEDARLQVENGALYTQFCATDGRSEKPMGLTTALELMTEVRKFKSETDRENLQAGKRPPPFPEFFIDFMTVKFGSRADGTANCNRLMLALLRMYKQRHGLATFYVRLLRVYHYAPLSYAFSISALQLAEGFSPLAETCASAKVAKNLLPADLHQTGGEAFLVPLMETILNLFEGQPIVSRLVLQGLVGEEDQLADYRKLKFALALKRTNSTVDKLFGATTQTDKAQFSALVAGAAEAVFSQQEAELLFAALTAGPTITKAEVAKAVAAVRLEEARNDVNLIVPLGAYLLALADTFHYLVRDHLFNVQNLLQSFGWQNITLANFNELAAAAGIQVPAAVSQSWFDEARGSQATLTPDGAIRVLIKFPVHIRPPLVPAELTSAALVVVLSEVLTTTKRTIVTTKTVVKKVVVKKAPKK